MFESNNQMHGLIAHLVRVDFWFEIECAETAVTAPGNIKLWIEIEYPLARQIDNAQIEAMRDRRRRACVKCATDFKRET
jgi:hypothetical protein